ncbi:MAG: hypothetical protein ACYDH9_27115, partial [Limisphaerales bacterium]
MDSTLSTYQQEINKNRAAAIVPHYAFVQFLVVVCGGMLGLSAPLQTTPTDPSRLPELLSLLAMTSLAISVICGVVALYG